MVRDGLLNYLLYQAGWFACVGLAGRGETEWAAAAAAVPTAVHFLLARDRGRELAMAAGAVAVGLSLDSILGWAGVVRYAGAGWAGGLPWVPPLFLGAMWAQFATLFHFSLRWLSGRSLLMALLGAVGGPLAFLGGERLGAVFFPLGRAPGLLALAAGWALAAPILLRVSDLTSPGGGGSYRLGRRAME